MKKIKVYKDCLFFKTFTRKHSSKEWLLRQKTDPYVEKAKINSYRYCKVLNKYIYFFNHIIVYSCISVTLTK